MTQTHIKLVSEAETFQRETRYVVFKAKDLECLDTFSQFVFSELCKRVEEVRTQRGKHGLECVVIESDWPEYETVWQMIESRMTGVSMKNCATVTQFDYKDMVNRFLQWKLPKEFNPDCGIVFTPSLQQKSEHNLWPTGTNLFHAEQAEEMFKHCVKPLLASAPEVGEAGTDKVERNYVYEDGIEPGYDKEPAVILALRNTELQKRVEQLEDLLSSAYNIANRNGEDTHWPRFAAQLHVHGISPVTAKTFKILPSDEGYQPDRTAQLEAEVAELKDQLANHNLVSKLIDAWCSEHGGKISWGKAIEINTIIGKLTNSERVRLLTMDDPDIATENSHLAADNKRLVEEISNLKR